MEKGIILVGFQFVFILDVWFSLTLWLTECLWSVSVVVLDVKEEFLSHAQGD